MRSARPTARANGCRTSFLGRMPPDEDLPGVPALPTLFRVVLQRADRLGVQLWAPVVGNHIKFHSYAKGLSGCTRQARSMSKLV